MRISDWSSDVCSSDLSSAPCVPAGREVGPALQAISSGVAMLCVPPGALCADAVPAEKASEPAAIARTSCFISVLLLLAMSRRPNTPSQRGIRGPWLGEHQKADRNVSGPRGQAKIGRAASRERGGEKG